MRRSSSGFTLIEIAAAVVIMAMLVIPLLGARNRTTASAIDTSHRFMVTQLAASKMSEVASKPLAEISRSGSFEDAPQYSWSFSITPDTEDETFRLYTVRLTVTHGEVFSDDDSNAITVSTLIMESEEEE